MNKFTVEGKVNRFPGNYGWYYVELNQILSEDLRPLLKDKWPSLLNSSFTINSTNWESSIMPIKNGPLFIALPLKVRKAENLDLGDTIKIEVELI